MNEQCRSLPKPVYGSAEVVVAVCPNAPTNVVRGNEQKTVVVCWRYTWIICVRVQENNS